MIKEDIYCGLIWDTELNKFVGLFTIRDFLNLMKVTHDKIKIHFQNNGKWTNVKNLVSDLFHRNKIDCDELDAILEIDPESKYNSDTKSEKSDNCEMTVDDEEMKFTIENTLKNYKEFFKMFEYINISEYINDIHPVNFFLSYNNFKLIGPFSKF
jgi:hypothetical protein